MSHLTVCRSDRQTGFFKIHVTTMSGYDKHKEDTWLAVLTLLNFIVWIKTKTNKALHNKFGLHNSQTGTRTRVAWVKATYPNRLDYLGMPQGFHILLDVTTCTAFATARHCEYNLYAYMMSASCHTLLYVDRIGKPVFIKFTSLRWADTINTK